MNDRFGLRKVVVPEGVPSIGEYASALHMNLIRVTPPENLNRIAKNGCITMDQDSLIDLTESGSAIARRIYERHKVLTCFLTQLGVDERIAREDACKIEHDISEETFTAIRGQIREA